MLVDVEKPVQKLVLTTSVLGDFRFFQEGHCCAGLVWKIYGRLEGLRDTSEIYGLPKYKMVVWSSGTITCQEKQRIIYIPIEASSLSCLRQRPPLWQIEYRP